jgi:hypothetical protein
MILKVANLRFVIGLFPLLISVTLLLTVDVALKFVNFALRICRQIGTKC